MRWIHAVVAEKGIELISFIQPTLLCKDQLTPHEQKRSILGKSIWDKQVIEAMEEFKERASEIKKMYGYI